MSPAAPRKLLSLVVPIYNEADNVQPFYERLAAVAALLDRDVELIFVDDGSRDDSAARVAHLRDRDRRVRLLRLSRNFGSHGACLAGLAHARGDHAVNLAADLQDPPEILPDLLAAADAGHDVVVGCRETRDDPALGVFFSNLYHRLMRRIAMPTWPERGFDFILVSRRVLEVTLAHVERNNSLFGEVLWAGFRQASVPYRRMKRHAGRSKWTLGKRVKLAIDSLVGFSYLPIRLISAVGLACASLGGLYALFVLAMRLLFHATITGWASLMVVVLVIGGVQMVMLGVIGEYLWRALDELRGRPPFIVAERLGFEATEAPVLSRRERARSGA